MKQGFDHLGDGRVGEAVDVFTRLLQIQREEYGNDFEVLENSLKLLHGLHLRLREFDRADRYREELLQLAVKRYRNSKHWRVVEMNVRLTGTALVEKLSEQDRRQVDESNRLHQEAIQLHQQGRFREGFERAEQGLRIRERIAGANHEACAASLQVMAALAESNGDFVRAKSLLRRALTIEERVFGPDHPQCTMTLNVLALTYQRITDFQEAEPLFLRAHSTLERASSEEPTDEELREKLAVVLTNLAALYVEWSRPEKALPLLQQSGDLWKQTKGTNSMGYASIINSLGAIRLERGETKLAVQFRRESAEIIRLLLGENHPTHALMIGNLAVALKADGDRSRAEFNYKRALKLLADSVGTQHQNYLTILENLATFYFRTDRPECRRTLLESLRIHEQLLRDTFSGLSERQRFLLLQERRAALDLLLSLRLDSGLAPGDLYNFVLAWKGSATAKAIEDRVAYAAPHLQKEVAELRDLRSRIARMAFSAPQPDEFQEWQAQMVDLRRKKEALEVLLAEKSGTLRRERVLDRLTWDQIVDKIPTGSVFIDFLEYNHSDDDPSRENEKRLLAFVLMRGLAPAMLDLGSLLPIENAVWAWREMLESISMAKIRTSAAKVRGLIWDKIEPIWQEGGRDKTLIRSIMIAPDGPLNHLALAALHNGEQLNGRDRFLIDRYLIHYVSSGRHLYETLTAPEAPVPAIHRALVIADADYNANTQIGDSAKTLGEGQITSRTAVIDKQTLAGFTPLPESRHLGNALGELHRKRFPNGDFLFLRGTAPDEATVKRELGNPWHHVLIYTHGFYATPSVVNSFQSSGNQRRNSVLDSITVEKWVNTLGSVGLFSGIALAGASRPAPDRDRFLFEDNLLTAEEVASLRLSEAELIVLSACVSASGPVVVGDGASGIQRSFYLAGARSLVTAHWEVEHRPTMELMESFFRYLYSDLGKLEALRQAQLDLLAKPGDGNAHPRRWGAWVLSGVPGGSR